MKLFNRIVTTDRTPIFFGLDALSYIGRFIPDNEIFILVDQETRRHCLPVLLDKAVSLKNARILETTGGEVSKSLATAERLWAELLSAGADRNSLLVNLGGGVVSDLGGFIAAGFKRGINYINIPTSLMGQADAAIGGKTAVNLGQIKNQVGFFYAAKAVFIFPGFLNTLPVEHLRSGLAEIIKSALVSDATVWRRLSKRSVSMLLQEPVEGSQWLNLVAAAVKFKNRVVIQDYREHKMRKVLNFGHTIGHALEGYSQTASGKQLLHGDAVAAGMICASYLSHRKTGLEIQELEAIRTYLAEGFPVCEVPRDAIPAIMELMMHDKKNRNGQTRFTLISKPGIPVIDVSCTQQEVMEAIGFLNDTLSGCGVNRSE